jgi:hypothetical protein
MEPECWAMPMPGRAVGGEVVSTAADATGVGAIVGVPGKYRSGVAVLHGSTTFTVAGQHLLKGNNNSSSKRTGDFTDAERSRWIRKM